MRSHGGSAAGLWLVEDVLALPGDIWIGNLMIGDCQTAVSDRRRVGSGGSVPVATADSDALQSMMEGIPIAIIQRQLGHSSLATTDIYLSHIAPKQVIEAISIREWSI